MSFLVVQLVGGNMSFLKFKPQACNSFAIYSKHLHNCKEREEQEQKSLCFCEHKLGPNRPIVRNFSYLLNRFQAKI
jgi:hypothetical protein